MQRITDNALYQRNLVSNLTFTLNDGRKDITVPGILRMRKDEVIRLQLLIPILRSEVGRIEFTKDYVLFIDRIHKQYVKASYDEVGFLRDMVSTSIRFNRSSGSSVCPLASKDE